MIKQLLKLIWKKKKTNFLMMLEIFVSFLILFAAWTLGLFYYQNFKQTDNMETTNVWALFCGFDNDSARVQKRDLIKQKLSTYPEIITFAFSNNNVPFSFSSNNPSFSYKGNRVGAESYHIESNMKEVLGLKMLEGDFLSKAGIIGKYKPIVLNRTMKEKLFGTESAMGKLLDVEEGEIQHKVIGVVENFKFESDFQEIRPLVIMQEEEWSKVCLIKVKPGTDLDFEAKISKEIAALGVGWSLEVQRMENMRDSKNKISLVPILILFILFSFLIFNVALGLFGVLFQSISKRKGEIGLRRSVGASENSILWQFIGETILIASIAILLGIFFAIQFPLLHVFESRNIPWTLSITSAALSIYFIIIICAYLPSRQASRVQPAIALHED